MIMNSGKPIHIRSTFVQCKAAERILSREYFMSLVKAMSLMHKVFTEHLKI